MSRSDEGEDQEAHLLGEPSRITTTCNMVRKAVYRAYSGRCFYTGSKISFDNFHIDHLVPDAKGGADCFSNYVACRPDINLAKSDFLNRDTEDFPATRYLVKHKYAPRALKLYRKLVKDRQEESKRPRKSREAAPSTEPESAWPSLEQRQLLMVSFLSRISRDHESKCAWDAPVVVGGYSRILLKVADARLSHSEPSFVAEAKPGFSSIDNLNVSILSDDTAMYVDLSYRRPVTTEGLTETELSAWACLDQLYRLSPDDRDLIRERSVCLEEICRNIESGWRLGKRSEVAAPSHY